MLDLSVLSGRTWELRLFDGSIINIRKPSQKMVMEMMLYERLFKEAGREAEKIEKLAELVRDILNNNTDGKEFTKDFVNSEFSFDIAFAVIKGYMEFTQELNSDPNL